MHAIQYHVLFSFPAFMESVFKALLTASMHFAGLRVLAIVRAHSRTHAQTQTQTQTHTHRKLIMHVLILHVNGKCLRGVINDFDVLRGVASASDRLRFRPCVICKCGVS